MSKFTFSFFLALVFYNCVYSQSQYQWAVGNGNFNTASNWTVSGTPPSVGPGTLDDVIIQNAGTYTVTLNTTSTVLNLTLNNTNTIFNHDSGTFTTGDMSSVNNNTFTLQSGTYNLNAGVLNLFGGMTMNAGTVNLTKDAVINNYLSQTLQINGGVFNLNYGVINGGYIEASGNRINVPTGFSLVNGNAQLGTIANATIGLNSLNFSGSGKCLKVLNCIFAPGSTYTLNDSSYLLVGTQLTGVTLNLNGGLNGVYIIGAENNNTFTISPNTTIRGLTGYNS